MGKMLFLIAEDEFDNSISLRGGEPEAENRRINWARDFEFDQHWPPQPDIDENPVSERETISRVTEKLLAEDVRVAKPFGSTRYQLIVEEGDGTMSRMRVKTG